MSPTTRDRTSLTAADNALLRDLWLLLHSGRPLDDLFPELERALTSAIPCETLGMLIATGRPGKYRVLGQGCASQQERGGRPGRGDEILDALMAGGGLVTRYPIESAPAGFQDGLREFYVAHAAAAVMLAGGERLGLLQVGRRNGGFSDSEAALLGGASSLIAALVAERLRIEGAQAAQRRGEVLIELSMLLKAGEPVDRIFERLSPTIRETMEYDYVEFARSDGHAAAFEFNPNGTQQSPPVTVSSARIRDIELIRSSGRAVVQYLPDRVESAGAASFGARGLKRILSGLVEHGGQTFGVLSIGRRAHEPFSSEDEAFLMRVMSIAGEAMAAERRLARAERGERRNAILNDFSLVAHAGEPAAAMAQKLADSIAGVVDFDWIVVHLLEGPGGGFVTLISQPDLGPGERELERGLGAGIRLVLATGNTIAQYRPDRAPGALAAAASAVGIRRALTAVLQDGSTAMGVLTLGRKANEAFVPDDVAFVQNVARVLAQALANQVHLAAVETAGARRRVLTEAAILLNAGEPVEELFQQLPAVLAAALTFDNLTLFVARDDADTFTANTVGPLAWSGKAEVEPEFFGLSDVLADGGAVVARGWAEGHSAFGALMSEGGQVWGAMAALRGRDEIVGMLAVSRTLDRAFDESETAFLEILATIFAQAAANQARIRRSQQEADEQRLIAALAASAASEAEFTTVLATLDTMLGGVVPGATVAFGFAQGGEVIFRRGPDGDFAVERSAMYQAAERDGQVVMRWPAGAPEDPFRRMGARAIALTASRSAGETIGYLLVATTASGYEFPGRVLRLLRLATQVSGPALANARAAEQMRIHAAEQELIAQVVTRAALARDPASLADALEESMASFVPDPEVLYGFLEGEAINWVTGRGAMRMPIRSEDRAAMASGQGVTGRASAADSEQGAAPGEAGGGNRVLSASHSGGEVTGILDISSSRAGHAFSRRDLRIFGLIAEMIGPVMENARATERTARERTLYDLALSSLSEAIILLDNDFKVAFANAAGERVVAVTLPGDRPVTESADVFDPSVQVALARASKGQGGRAEGRVPFPGDTRTYEFETIPLTHPEFRTLIVGSDITERVRREEEVQRHTAALDASSRAIAEQRDLYQLVINTLSEGVVLFDESAEAVICNPPGEQILAAIDPAPTRRSFAAKDAALPGQAGDDLTAAMADGHPARGRAQLVMEDGPRWFDYEFIPLDRPGLRLLAVAADVTGEVEREDEQERHRQQIEQSSRLAALGEMISGVAHELNNPLTAILGFAEMLSLAPGASDFAEELTVIQKEAIRARDVVRDLLFIARPGPAERGTVDLNGVLGHIERLRRSDWNSAGIDVSMLLPAEMTLWGNEHQLTQVLLNLVTNAEHAVEGRASPTIAIGVTVSAAEAVLTVTDNGRGMDDAMQKRIFEPFFTGRPGVGTGLGLSLSRSLVAAHGGRMEVDSKPGVGTAFRVILPSAAPPEPVVAEANPAGGRSLRVLLIDDEPSLRKIGGRLIARLGHECQAVASAEEVASILATREFDLVLCDYRLAAGTADDVVAVLAASAPQLIRHTVIATGAISDRGVVALKERYGLLVVAKPYGLDELRQVLETAGRLAPA